jgi:hypothetical protein
MRFPAVRHPLARLLALAVLVALALGAPTLPARANGTPIRIVLSYLNGVSNVGPQNATGVAELITSEGEVRLQAAGLQKLGDDEQYELWISSAAANERMALGPVTIGDGGVARMDTVLRAPIPEKPWDLMVITVEKKGADPNAPSERRAIAGRFSMTPGEGDRPRQLPNTGGDVPASALPPTPVSGPIGLSTAGLILLGFLLAVLIAAAILFAFRTYSKRTRETGPDREPHKPGHVGTLD